MRLQYWSLKIVLSVSARLRHSDRVSGTRSPFPKKHLCFAMAMEAMNRCAVAMGNEAPVGPCSGLFSKSVRICRPQAQDLLGSRISSSSSCLASERLVQRLQVKMQPRIAVRASQGLNQSEESVSTSSSDTPLRELKGTLMKSITGTNRGKSTTFEQRRNIFKLIEELEERNSTQDPVDSPLFSGRWALLYTAPIDESTSDKYAGTEEGPFLARVKPAAFGFVKQTRSTQVLDTVGGTAQNIADFTLFGKKGSLNIKGKVVKAAPLPIGVVQVDVTFENFELKLGDWTSPTISLSWVNPKGWINTTYLDEDMRVGRGDKGSIFVAVIMTRE